MNLKSIIAGGPVAILTVGAGAVWAQHELHYLLRPSVIETIAGIAAIGGGMVWAKNRAKRATAAPQEQSYPQPTPQQQQFAQQPAPQQYPAPQQWTPSYQATPLPPSQQWTTSHHTPQTVHGQIEHRQN